MTSVVYLTRKGIKDLKKSIHHLEQQQAQLIRSLKEGDRTAKREDRLDFNQRLAQLESVEIELFDKQSLLKNVKQMPKQSNRLTVAVGSVVELLDRQGKRLRYTLVESIEADPSQGRISTSSPLGSKLLGKQLREVVKWTTGRGVRQVTLVGIS